MKHNVVDLGAFKALRQKEKVRKLYGRYLRSLRDEQLPSEMRHLQAITCNDDFIEKGILLSREFASRAKGSIKSRIEKMNEDILSLI